MLPECRVAREKVTRYLLDPTSPDGAAKARFFMAFGFDPADPDILVEALRLHGTSNPIAESYRDRWGEHVNVVGPLACPNGARPTILTGWIKDGDGLPRLVTAFPA